MKVFTSKFKWNTFTNATNDWNLWVILAGIWAIEKTIINKQKNNEKIFLLLARGPEIISHGIAPNSEMGN